MCVFFVIVVVVVVVTIASMLSFVFIHSFEIHTQKKSTAQTTARISEMKGMDTSKTCITIIISKQKKALTTTTSTATK